MMCLLKSNCGKSNVSRPTQSKELALVTRELYLVSAFIPVGHSVLQVREPITFRTAPEVDRVMSPRRHRELCASVIVVFSSRCYENAFRTSDRSAATALAVRRFLPP